MLLQHLNGFVGVNAFSLGDQPVSLILVAVALRAQRLLDEGAGLRPAESAGSDIGGLSVGRSTNNGAAGAEFRR